MGETPAHLEPTAALWLLALCSGTCLCRTWPAHCAHGPSHWTRAQECPRGRAGVGGGQSWVCWRWGGRTCCEGGRRGAGPGKSAGTLAETTPARSGLADLPPGPSARLAPAESGQGRRGPRHWAASCGRRGLFSEARVGERSRSARGWRPLRAAHPLGSGCSASGFLSCWRSAVGAVGAVGEALGSVAPGGLRGRRGKDPAFLLLGEW